MNIINTEVIEKKGKGKILDYAPLIIYYEENNNQGNICGISYYKNHAWEHVPIPNEDSFKSITLINVPWFFRLDLYDDRNYGTHDDYCIIKVISNFVKFFEIPSLESNILTNPDVELRKFGGGDLDGEVSAFKFYYHELY